MDTSGQEYDTGPTYRDMDRSSRQAALKSIKDFLNECDSIRQIADPPLTMQQMMHAAIDKLLFMERR